jgi:hypothetical protein
MSSFSNPDKGKLTIENFAEFLVDIMNMALRYGQAGEEIIDDVEKEFEMPDADAKVKRKGMEREEYIFRHSDTNKLTEGGRMQYEQALKMHFEGMRHYHKHRGELSHPNLRQRCEHIPSSNWRDESAIPSRYGRLSNFAALRRVDTLLWWILLSYFDSSMTKTLQHI